METPSFAEGNKEKLLQVPLKGPVLILIFLGSKVLETSLSHACYDAIRNRNTYCSNLSSAIIRIIFTPEYTKKRTDSIESILSCGRRDLNPQECNLTRT